MKNPIKFLIILLIFSLINTGCEKNNPSPIESVQIKKTKKDPLPSWNDGSTKKEILAFVDVVTDKNNSKFIPVSDRIATFDNDGNLWSEQPAYFQLFFAIDRVIALADDHPEWKSKQPFKAVLENDMEELIKQGEHGLLELVMATHAGVSTSEFEIIVQEWIKTAKHPTKKVGYDKLVYQPMLELLNFLRANNFKTYIVSGGGIDFMRAFVSPIYGIPSEQIIGSSIKTKYEYNDGRPQIIKEAELDFINDKDGKPLNI